MKPDSGITAGYCRPIVFQLCQSLVYVLDYILLRCLNAGEGIGDLNQSSSRRWGRRCSRGAFGRSDACKETLNRQREIYYSVFFNLLLDLASHFRYLPPELQHLLAVAANFRGCCGERLLGTPFVNQYPRMPEQVKIIVATGCS